jgi:hypothetical protein
VSNTRQRYDELMIDRAWDTETQIKLVLEYVDEFKLSDHFISYLGIKPASAPDQLVPSANYSLNQLIQMVIKSDKITGYIQDNVSLAKTDEPWDAPSIIKCIARGLSINVDLKDEQLVQELLTYFNYRHTSLRKAMGGQNPEKVDVKEDNYLGKLLGSYINKEQPDEADKDGDDYFDGMLTRFASLGSGGKAKAKKK